MGALLRKTITSFKYAIHETNNTSLDLFWNLSPLFQPLIVHSNDHSRTRCKSCQRLSTDFDTNLKQFANLEAQLMTVPPYAVAYVVTLAASWSADHFNA